jgi:hypothetical protein
MVQRSTRLRHQDDAAKSAAAKDWIQYERARRQAGNNDQFGLVYGLSFILEPTDCATKGHHLSFRSAKERAVMGEHIEQQGAERPRLDRERSES